MPVVATSRTAPGTALDTAADTTDRGLEGRSAGAGRRRKGPAPSGHSASLGKVVAAPGKEVVEGRPQRSPVRESEPAKADEDGAPTCPWWHRKRLRYCSYAETPLHLRDNVYLHHGYRVDYSYLENYISIFHLHNETGNIWTHLVPFFLFLSWIWTSGGWLSTLIAQHAGTAASGEGSADAAHHASLAFWHTAVVCGYLACNCITFITSTLFHTNLCHKRHEVFIFFGCLDYSGISTTICGSTCAVAYYLFFCDPVSQGLWLVGLGLPNLVGVVGPMFRFWGSTEFRGYRTLIYIVSATLSGLPIVHYILVDSVWALPPASWYGLLGMTSFYLFGAFLYVHQYPERWWPGRFDYFFHSHQIWHVCVVAAAYCHLHTILSLMRWRLQSGACPAL